MSEILDSAFGKPGIAPRWAHGNKDGIGTAFSSDSPLWFTLAEGFVTEVYYPTIDSPQIRDVQLLTSDGKSFVHQESDFISETHYADDHALIYQIHHSDRQKKYTINTEVFSCPHLPSLLQKIKLEVADPSLKTLNLYIMCHPHLHREGKHNNAHRINAAGHRILMAEREGIWLAITASIPFSKCSCGYAGTSDVVEDLKNFQMDWEFEQALDGNVVLSGELILKNLQEVIVVLAFGQSKEDAVSNLLQTLAVPYQEHRQKYIEQWKKAFKKIIPLSGRLYQRSIAVLLSHEDKLFPGAFIASLAIPFGRERSDSDKGGYHLVWARDAVQTATGLLAAGHKQAALRALIYLAAGQKKDGKFSQDMWVNQTAHAEGLQLDEVAYPILLAYYLAREKALEDFDPYLMVKKAAVYMIKKGPATHEDRWEEKICGFSPNTLACMIAGLICSCHFARLNGEEKVADYFQSYADFLESHVEEWTITTEGSLIPEIKSHYVRINPVKQGFSFQKDSANTDTIELPQRYPDEPKKFPVKEIIDAGFLHLVRFGIRSAQDPLILDSLKVVDKYLKVETPCGTCWKRYTHDGYGQQDNGKPLEKAGRGRAWPLFTGERGHYELAAKNDTKPYIKALEGFAHKEALIPEQIWDSADLPSASMYLGYPTDSARPLAWAHAEYIKLLRSSSDNCVFDVISEVKERYLTSKKPIPIEWWDFVYQSLTVKKNHLLRIQAQANFILKFTWDNWETTLENEDTQSLLDFYYIDLIIPENNLGSIHFTFFWTENQMHENKNYEIKIVG